MTIHASHLGTQILYLKKCIGDGERGTGNREPVTGNRQLGTGNRQRGTILKNI